MVSRVLPAIVAAGVGVAGVALWRLCGLRRLLRRARWIVAALAAFGAATLLYASVVGLSLRQALSGAALPAVPYVLQGTFIGAFVILTMGWILPVLRAGFPRFRSRSAIPATCQALALTVCMALVFTSLPERQTRRGSGLVVLTPTERQEALERSLRTIQQRERESPRDRWDPDYVVSVVGRVPQRLFAWVRDNTFGFHITACCGARLEC
jgi:hypothetical protein